MRGAAGLKNEIKEQAELFETKARGGVLGRCDSGPSVQRTITNGVRPDYATTWQCIYVLTWSFEARHNS